MYDNKSLDYSLVIFTKRVDLNYIKLYYRDRVTTSHEIR